MSLQYIYRIYYKHQDTWALWYPWPLARGSSSTGQQDYSNCGSSGCTAWFQMGGESPSVFHSFCHPPNVLDQLAVSRFRSTGHLTNFPRLPSRAQETEDYERALAAALATENRDEENVRAEESTRSKYVSNNINQFNNDSAIVCDTVILLCCMCSWDFVNTSW